MEPTLEEILIRLTSMETAMARILTVVDALEEGIDQVRPVIEQIMPMVEQIKENPMISMLLG